MAHVFHPRVFMPCVLPACIGGTPCNKFHQQDDQMTQQKIFEGERNVREREDLETNNIPCNATQIWQKPQTFEHEVLPITVNEERIIYQRKRQQGKGYLSADGGVPPPGPSNPPGTTSSWL